MKYRIRVIETVAEMEGLIWEVPGANYTLPALKADASKEEIWVHEIRAARAIENCMATFEDHNHVVLNTEPANYFKTVAEDIYKV